jgi:hypothetical protein
MAFLHTRGIDSRTLLDPDATVPMSACVGFLAGVTSLAAILSGLPHAWGRSRVAPLVDLSAATLRTTDDRDRPGFATPSSLRRSQWRWC